MIISALADGISEIHGLLTAADPRSTLSCLQQLGAQSDWDGPVLRVKGSRLYGLSRPEGILDAGNSGTTIRLLAGVLAGQRFTSQITGDDSLRKRPMRRIIEPLSLMGARFEATPALTAPLTVHGAFPLRAIDFQMPIASAQVKSAVLLAGLFADGTTRVSERTQTRDHTERMLDLQAKKSSTATTVEVVGGIKIPAQIFQVPGDISSAAFLIAAALLVPNSELCIQNVGLNPTRTRILEILRSVGGSIDVLDERTVVGEPMGDLLVKSSTLAGNLELGGELVAELIDEIPILSVVAALSGCSMVVRGASDLRNKESDRIKALVLNLRSLGSDVEEYQDGFALHGKKSLIPAEFISFGDHRIAMSFGVAGLALPGETVIKSSDCVEISFPAFWDLLRHVQRQ